MASAIDSLKRDFDSLHFLIRNETPPSAQLLGEFLTALAGDYRRATRGRELAVVSVEAGSILIYLRDAFIFAYPLLKDGMELAKAIDAMHSFAGRLRNLFERTKYQPSSLTGRQIGAKSMAKLLELAEKAKGEIEFHYKSEIETIDFKVTSSEAMQARAAVLQAGTPAQPSFPVTGNSVVPTVGYRNLLGTTSMFGEPNLKLGVSSLGDLAENSKSLLKAVSAAMGLPYVDLLSKLAAELNGRGDVLLATAVEKELSRQS